MSFCLFPTSHGKLIFQEEKVMEIHGILQKLSVPSMIYGDGRLLVCIYKITTFFHALTCMCVYVCLVMVVAVRGGHLYFSKKIKFMVQVYF